MQLNATLEEENKALMDQVNKLLAQVTKFSEAPIEIASNKTVSFDPKPSK